MLTLGPTRILTYAACLALLAAPLGAAADTPVDASKLSGDELMKLAPSTSVKLDSGRIATIADLLSEHKARLARLGSAKTLGAQAVLSVNPSLLKPIAGLGGAPKGPSGLTLVPQNYDTDYHWAKDYVDFCTAAKASACIYVPSYTTFTVGGTGDLYLIDTDPFMGAPQCASEGGLMAPTPGSKCMFRYPHYNGIHFPQGDPPASDIESTCFKNGNFSGFFTGIYDPHGYFQITLKTGTGTFTNVNQPVTCVASVYAKT